MKIRFFLLFLLTGTLSCQSDPDNQGKREEIKSILADYFNAMAKKDLPKMKELTTPDFVLYEGGDIYNNESAVRAVEKISQFTVQFKFDSLNIRFGKADASTYYSRETTFTSSDSTYSPVKFLESATFEKQNGKWKLRFIHSSQCR